eukprot:scaffold2812_cov172-Ochromonas_danica.AAC.3
MRFITYSMVNSNDLFEWRVFGSKASKLTKIIVGDMGWGGDSEDGLDRCHGYEIPSCHTKGHQAAFHPHDNKTVIHAINPFWSLQSLILVVVSPIQATTG